ncbi:tyrosine-type recombinase/integrase (plasmid) [Myxococcus stipitatus]|uniref:site-specific integrase n=1 Tax=Myxococcus stipitatus TaxID=83455 RepID=UPI003144F1C4
MSPSPIVLASSAAVVPTEDLYASAREYAAAARAPRTLKEYQRDWDTFSTWCAEKSLVALPALPSTLALYCTARAKSGKKVSTIQRGLSAIAQVHLAAGLPSPRDDESVRTVLKGIRRKHGIAQDQKAPLLPAHLRSVSSALPESALGHRDRALLFLCFAGAFRREELCSLNLEDLSFTDAGVEVRLRKSKTDQEAAGARKGIPFGSNPETCPVVALRLWLKVLHLQVLGTGVPVPSPALAATPLFRPINRHSTIAATRLTPGSVARIVKRSAEAIGLDPAHYSGHSPRAGLITAAVRAGKPLPTIMRQTGQRSVATLARYVRESDLFAENAAANVGL